MTDIDYRKCCIRYDGDHAVLRYGATAAEAGEGWSDVPRAYLDRTAWHKPSPYYVLTEPKYFFSERVTIHEDYQTDAERKATRARARQFILGSGHSGVVNPLDGAGGQGRAQETEATTRRARRSNRTRII